MTNLEDIHRIQSEDEILEREWEALENENRETDRKLREEAMIEATVNQGPIPSYLYDDDCDDEDLDYDM